jgi:hypothetical protein
MPWRWPFQILKFILNDQTKEEEFLNSIISNDVGVGGTPYE